MKKYNKKSRIKIVVSIIIVLVALGIYYNWYNSAEREYENAVTSIDDLDVLKKLVYRYNQLKTKTILTSYEIDEFKNLRKKLDGKHEKYGGELETIWKTQIR